MRCVGNEMWVYNLGERDINFGCEMFEAPEGIGQVDEPHEGCRVSMCRGEAWGCGVM